MVVSILVLVDHALRLVIGIDTELSVVITSKTDSLKISGPRNRLLKTAVVSTHGRVIPEDGDAEETPL